MNEKLSAFVERCAAPGARLSAMEHAQLSTALALERGECSCFACGARITKPVGWRLLALQVGDWVLVGTFCPACRRKLDERPAFAAGVRAEMQLHLAKLSAPLDSVTAEGVA